MNEHATPFAAGEIRLERTLPGPIDRIWAYLTEPGKRAKWFASRRPDPLWSTLARLEAEYEQRLRRVTVRVTRRFTASPELIFDAWLDPARIGQWMFGPGIREEEVLGLTVDPRIGGKFSFRVRRDGKEIDHVGTYRALDRPRRLAFTWGIAGESDGDSVVTIDIAPVDGGSELTLTHDLDPKWADYADRTEASWTKMLDALDGAVA